MDDGKGVVFIHIVIIIHQKLALALLTGNVPYADGDIWELPCTIMIVTDASAQRNIYIQYTASR